MTEAEGAGEDVAVEQRVVVVTGGGSGIGLAYGRAFAEAGCAVVLADVDRGVPSAAESLPGAGPHLGVVADVASEDDVAALARRVEEVYGHVDVLVNNAAIMLQLDRPFKPFEETSWDEWRRMFDVNVGGVFLMTRAMLPLLKAGTHACVVNVGSDAVWKGYDGQLAYFTSKGAIQTMTRCLARELGAYGIRVNCVAPGFTLSDAVRGSDVMMGVKHLVDGACVVQWDQEPADVAAAAVFLASEGARCISGHTMVVNRGAIMP
jgi:NAD(P)-dependent dehydrogenase (short-subunit alcohol dehydrogenase family)